MQKSVVVGTDIKSGQPVSLSEEDRRLSLYVVGKAGMGKSKLLEHIAYQDIQNGDGLLFLDPHADSAELLLCSIPEARRGDVIWWDPTDLERPFGLNPFVCHNPEEIDSRADNFIAALASLAEFSEVFTSAPRMKDVLLHMSIAFIVNQGYGYSYTLAETPRFLTEQAFRERFYPALDHDYPQVVDYWQNFDGKTVRAQSELVESSLNKLRRFQLNRTMRTVFGQATNSVDFRAAMDQGKIILVKLPGEQLGPDNAAFIGAFIVWGVFEAALSRAALPPGERRQFHLIADEFQTFMSTAFPRLLSEARKFGVDTTIAHQTRGQLTDERTRQTTLIVGNKIVFSVTGRDAEELAREFRIEVPAPEVIGQKPKYSYAHRPLDFIREHGLPSLSNITDPPLYIQQDEQTMEFYHQVRTSVDYIVDVLFKHIDETTVWESEAPTWKDRLSLVIRTKQERLETDLNDILYFLMTVEYSWHLASWAEGDGGAPIYEGKMQETYNRLYHKVFSTYVTERIPKVRIAQDSFFEARSELSNRDEEVRYEAMQRGSGDPDNNGRDTPEWQAWKGSEERRVEQAKVDQLRPVVNRVAWHNAFDEGKHRYARDKTLDRAWYWACLLYYWQENLQSTLFAIGTVLNKRPCITPSGDYEPVIEKPRLYSDVEAEMANELATLPRFRARASIMEEGTVGEYMLVMRAPLNSSPEGEASRHIISERSRLTYGRDRKEVEAVIRARSMDETRADNTSPNLGQSPGFGHDLSEAHETPGTYNKSYRPDEVRHGTIPGYNYGKDNNSAAVAKNEAQSSTDGEDDESLRDPK